MESLFFELESVDSLFLRSKELIISTFNKIGKSTPSPVVITTLAHISLFPHLRIANVSLETLYWIVKRDLPFFSLLPSPIFPSSSQLQQYSGLSFLSALTQKLRIVFSEFQRNLPTDPSHFPKYIQLTKDDQFIITRSLSFCSASFRIPSRLLLAIPPIEVDSEIIRELILSVKETLSTTLTNISNIDTLIASLSSDSSPTTPLVSTVDTQMTVSLKQLRHQCEDYVTYGLAFFIDSALTISDLHKSSFRTIVLDDPSFPDLILNSLKLNHYLVRWNTLAIVTNVVIIHQWMKERFMTANLVGTLFETVAFASLPLSESKTLFALAKFIANMFKPLGDDHPHSEQYPLIRVSVFEPAKPFIIFIFDNSNKLVLDAEYRHLFEVCICFIHHHIQNMELRSDEHDADFVAELVKWEVRQMVKVENKDHFAKLFRTMLNRTWEWGQNNQERQKRREVLLREEGWDQGVPNVPIFL